MQLWIYLIQARDTTFSKYDKRGHGYPPKNYPPNNNPPYFNFEKESKEN